MEPRSETLPVGVVMRRTQGVTRWAPTVWRAVAVLPGAGPADWRELRREGEGDAAAVEYHAATLEMELHRAETEAYRVALSNEPPAIWVILRPVEADDADEHGTGLVVHSVTASPFDAQDYLDSGEEIVEQIPAPPALIAWMRDFVERHHEDETFVKRKRDRQRTDLVEDGIGDPRVRQQADVYRAPTALKPLKRLN